MNQSTYLGGTVPAYINNPTLHQNIHRDSIILTSIQFEFETYITEIQLYAVANGSIYFDVYKIKILQIFFKSNQK